MNFARNYWNGSQSPIIKGATCQLNFNILNEMFDMNVDFEQAIATIQGYKAQIIGFAVSSQTMVMGYKDIVQKMKDKGNESFYEVFSEELEKIGI